MVDEHVRIGRQVLVRPLDLRFVDSEGAIQSIEAIERAVDPIEQGRHLGTAGAHDVGGELDRLERRVGDVAQREERAGEALGGDRFGADAQHPPGQRDAVDAVAEHRQREHRIDDDVQGSPTGNRCCCSDGSITYRSSAIATNAPIASEPRREIGRQHGRGERAELVGLKRNPHAGRGGVTHR